MEQDLSASLPETEKEPGQETSEAPPSSAKPQQPEGAAPDPTVVPPSAKPSPAPPLAASADAPRVEVSAATVTRMMGIASTADLRLLEGRVDLLTSKVTGLLTKVDRVLSMFGSIPTSSDVGRLEIQIGAVKSMLRELLEANDGSGTAKRQTDTKDAAEEQSRKLREGIRSSSE